MRRKKGPRDGKDSQAPRKCPAVIVTRSPDSVEWCVHLPMSFGDRYKITTDDSFALERSEFQESEQQWHYQIPLRSGGHIYAFSAFVLAAYIPGGPRSPTRRRLDDLGCCVVYQAADREATYLFDSADFERVAEVVEPRRRKRLEGEHRARTVSRLVKANEASRFRPRFTVDGAANRGSEREVLGQDVL